MKAQVNFDSLGGGGAKCECGTVTSSQVQGQDTAITFTKSFTPKIITAQTIGGTYQSLCTWSAEQPTTTLYNSTYNNTTVRQAFSAGDTSYSNVIISGSVTNNGFSITSAQLPSWGYGTTVEWYAWGE